MFPWLSPDYISAWCRVMQIGASKIGGGFLWLPEIGDEVLIGFDRGPIDHPFVIGNLYNGIAAPLPPRASRAWWPTGASPRGWPTPSSGTTGPKPWASAS